MNLIGTLAFLVTLVVLALALALTVLWLAQRRTAAASRAAALMLAWIAAYAGILIAVSLASRAPILEQGQEHCFDEMCFSVQGVTLTDALGTSRANGVFYVVDIRLRNAARATAQKPSDVQIWVIDDNGHEYRQFLIADGDRAGQAITAGEIWNRRINPGDRVEQAVAFDLPDSVASPRLVIAEGPGFPTTVIIGDENSLFHPKTTFRLKP